MTGRLRGTGQLELPPLSVRRARIDLEGVSAALGIGRITGRRSGSIKGLRVAYGQPVAFDPGVESVPSKDVSHSVSLKAVNSISLVSTGSGPSGPGVSLMTMFFRKFPYERIGFEGGLENDVFTVRGLIHEDGVEYLVKQPFFSGIHVINGNPDIRVGFSDMLERARRVTGERSNRGGGTHPTVKRGIAWNDPRIAFPYPSWRFSHSSREASR